MADPSRIRRFPYDSDHEDGEVSSEDEPLSKKKKHNHENESEEEEQIVYCICRKSDTNRFMIGCDKCEEWYHGDCINITAEYAKRIKHFYCLSCREKQPGLEIVYNEKKPKRKLEKEKPKSPELIVRDKKKKGEDSGSDFERELQENRKKKTRFIVSDDDDDNDFVERKTIKKQSKNIKQTKSKSNQSKSSRHSQSKGSRHRRNSKDASSSRSFRRNTSKKDELPKQCFGPGCVEASRKGSKYCCDACGIKLATNRIYEILPGRISQWQKNPSLADDISNKQLEKTRLDSLDARKQLQELDKKQEALDELIEKSKKVLPFTEDEMEDYEDQMNQEGDADLSTYCVTCGHEISNKIAVRHMERCFSKYEAQSSLGSIFKTKIDNLFCDFFNPTTKTYCKRLRVICPEHSKDPKIGDEEVCGFPLVQDVFNETDKFCRVPKKKCAKHHGWEKIRRALIDMERVQQWLRIDELFEKEQRIRWQMSCRGGVLSLMLHQTIPAEEGPPVGSSPNSSSSFSDDSNN